MDDESDRINLLQSQYNVERAKLEASKAEILSEIEGAKDRIDVDVSKGDLVRVKKTSRRAGSGARGRCRTSGSEKRQDGPRHGDRAAST